MVSQTPIISCTVKAWPHRARSRCRDGFASAHFNGGGHTKGILHCRMWCHILFCEMLKIILPQMRGVAALGVAGA